MNRRRFCVWSALALVALFSRVSVGAEEADPLSLKIKRQPVQSTHLASIGYDAGSRVLEVEFHNGDVYRYLDVPPAIVDALRAADSKGCYFARAIRGRFVFRLISKRTP